uniref:Uncharacterized protein n=1 Tax=Los Azufres archaeal virus 2 TaxID=1425359 RepID=A0A0A0PA24_9VIRU|nr:hypothetical protein [Los Azufres archaeal virus 2]
MKIAVAQEAIKRELHKDPHGGRYGTIAVRMKNSFAEAPRLVAFRQCVAGKVRDIYNAVTSGGYRSNIVNVSVGQIPPSLGAIQTAFSIAAKECKAEVTAPAGQNKPRSASKLMAIQSRHKSEAHNFLESIASMQAKKGA